MPYIREKNNDDISTIELVSTTEHNRLAKQIMDEQRRAKERGAKCRHEAWVMTVEQKPEINMV